MSDLTNYAKKEFEIFDQRVSDSNRSFLNKKNIKENLLELLTLIENQNHSGLSFRWAMSSFMNLTSYRDLNGVSFLENGQPPKKSLLDFGKDRLEKLDWKKTVHGPRLRDDILKLLEALTKQNHSPEVLPTFLEIFERLANAKPLTALMDSPEEWRDCGNRYQNLRCSSVFKEKKSKEFFDIDSVAYRNSVDLSQDGYIFTGFPYFPPVDRG